VKKNLWSWPLRRCKSLISSPSDLLSTPPAFRLIFSLQGSYLSSPDHSRARMCPIKQGSIGSNDAASKRELVKSFAANFGLA